MAYRIMRGTVAISLLLLTQVVSPAAAFKMGAQTITVPDGFEIELVAGPGLVDRPIEADFDEEGFLYVTDSSGSNDKPDKQLQEKPHRIVRLADIDGDGRYDKSVVFADKMMFPEGAMWHNGSLYVAAPPSIWKLTDTNGDGVADEREEWFQGKTLTGCANDLHGPYLGPDGWIYWTKGAFAKQTYERPGKPPLITRAAHIFRARPDGSGIEPVMTGGMDNPVGLVFTPAGERIFSTTFFQHPEAGRRDGLVHAIYGGVYGKRHDVIDEHKRTGDLMPVLTHLGPAAPAGLACYESEAFGKEYVGNVFASLFNLHKVTRHALEPEGATFRTEDSDFVVSDSTDFHPTDVLEDADGSLLVIDTGGWYKLCCPTSQLYKPDLLGAIYRVRRKGGPEISDARGSKVEWAKAQPRELARLLGDPRPAVRKRAIHALALRKENGIPALTETIGSAPNAQHRLNAVWALTRIDTPKARAGVRTALNDSADAVRIAATHSIAAWRDSNATPQLTRLLAHSGAHVKRAVAEALGRIGNKHVSSALLKEAAAEHDRVLEHSITYALIEGGDRETVSAALASGKLSSRALRAALVALDQMDDGGLSSDAVIGYLRSSDSTVHQTAEWIVARRPEWAAALIGFFTEAMSDTTTTDDQKDQVERMLKALGSQPALQKFVADVAGDVQRPRKARLTASRSMAQSTLKEMPPSWAAAIGQLLKESDAQLVELAVAAARTLPVPKDGAEALAIGLLGVAGQDNHSAQLRLDALAALPAGRKLDDNSFRFASAHVTPSHPVRVRSAAVTVMTRARLTSAQLTAVAGILKQVGPLEAPKLLGLFAKTSEETVGLKLIESLRASRALQALPAQTVRACLTNFPASVQEDALKLFLGNDAPSQHARLEQLLAQLPTGDVRRGQALFNSSATACSACHAIGYLGGNLGPDLTRIGQVRTERDLLEAIVFPSASFVRSYEPVVVLTRSGDQFSGVLRKDAPDEVLLGTGPGAETRIARAEIAELRPGSISVMPEGLDQQLSRQELSDLLAFLKATRW